MKKRYCYSLLLFFCFSCSSGQWNEAYVRSKCKNEMERQYRNNTLFTKERIDKLCNCIAEKTIKRYRSEDELERDSLGARTIGAECSITKELPK